MLKQALTFLALALATSAQTSSNALTVTQPSTEHWWISNSDNTVAWTSQSGGPTQFTVMLNNPNTALLSGRLALIAIEPAYETSKTINPGMVASGTGYTIQLCDPLNNTNIYAESSSFEVKPQGSAYPPQTTPGTSVSVAGAAASSPAGSSSSAAETPSKTGGAGVMSVDGICRAMFLGSVVLLGLVHWA